MDVSVDLFQALAATTTERVALPLSRALAAAGVREIESACSEDPMALQRMDDEAVLWLACDIGLARCSIGPWEKRMLGSIAVTVTLWSEVRGFRVSATIPDPAEEDISVAADCDTPAMAIKADNGRQRDRLRALADRIRDHLA